jgi:hypothetical protein
MGTIKKYNREFEFDDETPADVQEKRILNWMKQNAATELESEKPEQPEGKKFNPKLAMAAQIALRGLPGADMLSRLPGVQNRLGDVNLYRTLAQGALPVADEAVAGVRSFLPEGMGGADYSTALGEERQGVKDYKDQYGPGEAMAIEALGGIGALPIGGALMQGAKGLPVAGRGITALSRWAAANPWKSAPLIGGVTGAATGFASGENDFGERASNAAGMALLGAGLGLGAHSAVQGVKGVGNWASKDNAVANFLRSQIGIQRNLDINNPNFTRDAMTGLRRDMKERQWLDTQPMAADLLPQTAESVFQKSGPDVANLADSVLKRQYNTAIDPKLAREAGQYGRVGDAMDMAWGRDMFKSTDEALLAARKQNADALFEPAYRMNIRGDLMDDALNDPYVRGAWKDAVKKAEAQRRAIGPTDALGNVSSYNTEFLHDLKRSMDDSITAAMKSTDGQGPNTARIIRESKERLNKAIMQNNEPYKRAMQQYGDDSTRLDALNKGRNEVFFSGSVDQTGAKPRDVMDADAIRAYLSDPNIPQELKDLFQTGAARAYREKILGSDSGAFSHNWAKSIHKPKESGQVEALLDDKITALSHGPTINAWTLFQKKMAKESENYKNLINKGLGNSRTAVRESMKKDLEGGDFNPGAIVSAFVNPTAPSTWREHGRLLLDKFSKEGAKVNTVADILGRRGNAGNRSSLNDIERLLQGFDRREATYDRVSRAAPAAAAYVYPGREQ